MARLGFASIVFEAPVGCASSGRIRCNDAPPMGNSKSASSLSVGSRPCLRPASAERGASVGAVSPMIPTVAS